MREDSPRWEEINRSPHDHERAGLRELASYLPDADPYHVWANVEFVGTDGSINEIDALVLTPSGLIVLELKHWQGEISGNGTHWVRRPPNGRLTPYDNPYLLANRKAKRLASLIRHYADKNDIAQLPYRALYVDAAVFLHARKCNAKGLDDLGRQHVYGLEGNLSGLPSLKELLDARPAGAISPNEGRRIVNLVKRAKIRPSVANRKVGELLLRPEPFAEGIGWQDFLAGHSLDKSLVRRVRFYLTGRVADDEVQVIRSAATREFRLLQGIHHPGIAAALDLVDHACGPGVVFEHSQDAERLDHWLRRRESKLTVAQKLHLLQDLAEIVDYAHSRRLAHRAMHPRAVYVKEPDRSRPALLVTDWQTGGRLAGTTNVTRLSSTDSAGLDLFFDDEVRRYQAPEVVNHSGAPGTTLDVFSLGAIAYRIFAGRPPASSAEELVAAVRDSGLNLAGAVDGLPSQLVELVYHATQGDPAQRMRAVSEFRERLEQVWEELTAPEPEPVVDPLLAQKGDVLDGGLTVVKRLGSGATATALLVTEPGDDHGHARELVLKVARDERHHERLVAEGETLAKLSHPLVASLVRQVTVGNRTALLLDSAGKRTLADELREGRLALGLLERYGRDLLRVLYYLDAQGVWHRDIKPANLAARPRASDRQMHLCLFDFSLASAPADELNAGTPPYLDPFLGPPRRMRYDAAAERFAAAVTLYEMATGTVPTWGSDANPAAVTDEVNLDPAAFDPAVADRLMVFFAKALARDARQRFDTVEEMEDAWRRVFADLPESVPEPDESQATTAALTRSAPLEVAGLTPRARSALQRLGVYTVGELLAYEPSKLTRAAGVPEATRKEIRDRMRALRAQLPAPEVAAPVDAQVRAHGVEAVCATLLTKRTNANAAEHDTTRVLLGQAPTGDGEFLCWPTQVEVARATGQAQPQVSTWVRKHARRWGSNKALAQVRDQVVALLEARGSVMSARELAEALLASRGSYSPEQQRLPQAIGLVRAAVEAELGRGGESRVATQRFRGSDTVLIGREPDDPAATTTAADVLSYAVRLGRRAAELAGGDRLPTPPRAVEHLRAVKAPEGAPVLDDQRLLQVAAQANDAVDVNAAGQLYPAGMAAERALRLAANTLVGRLSAEQVAERVRARFPQAEPLPTRPRLDELLESCDVPLVWDSGVDCYVPRSVPASATTSRVVTSVGPLLEPAAVTEVDDRLASVIERRGFLAVLASLRLLRPARQALLERLGLVEVDVTAIMLQRLRALDAPWQHVLDADTGNPADANFRALLDLVRHHVVPAVAEALSVEQPVLITEAAPLARYDQLGLVREMTDISRTRPAARLLLVPARRPEPALLDGQPLPLTTPASQALWLPEAWLSPMPAGQR
jgi:serine/threonine protein kinase